MDVNHKDENKENNFVYINEDGTVDLEKSNLEWCDKAYNNGYGTRNKRLSVSLKGRKLSEENKRKIGIANSKSVLQIDPNTNEIIKEWSSMAEINRQLGYDKSNICNCCNGKLIESYGYIWKKKEEETVIEN